MRMADHARWAVAALLLAGCGGEPELTDFRVDRPARNLVIVCADTVRFDTFDDVAGLMPDDPLARFSNRTIAFENAYSTAPWTVPAVASVFTGRYPRSHGAGHLEGDIVNLTDEIARPLGPTTPTLAERLLAAEFNTRAITAHPWFRAGYGLDRGFKHLDLRRGWNRIGGRFRSWLEQRDPDDRFFFYLHFMEAHHFHAVGLHGLREQLAEVEPETLAALRELAPEPACRDPEDTVCLRFQVYALKVMEMRRALAYVLESLDNQGRLDDTVVVFYSDHGEEFHDHIDALTESADDPRGLYGFGHGQSLYQELIRIPLMVWHPDHAGRTVSEPVSLVDVTPSVLHWLDVLPEDLAPLSGVPLEFTLRGRQDQGFPMMKSVLQPHYEDEPRPLFASSIAYGARRVGVVSGDHKAIHLQHVDHIDYFDLAEDPLEYAPFVSDEMIYTLQPLIGDYMELVPAEQAEAPEIADEQLEQLKAIGYLQGVETKKGKDNKD